MIANSTSYQQQQQQTRRMGYKSPSPSSPCSSFSSPRRRIFPAPAVHHHSLSSPSATASKTTTSSNDDCSTVSTTSNSTSSITTSPSKQQHQQQQKQKQHENSPLAKQDSKPLGSATNPSHSSSFTRRAPKKTTSLNAPTSKANNRCILLPRVEPMDLPSEGLLPLPPPLMSTAKSSFPLLPNVPMAPRIEMDSPRAVELFPENNLTATKPNTDEQSPILIPVPKLTSSWVDAIRENTNTINKSNNNSSGTPLATVAPVALTTRAITPPPSRRALSPPPPRAITPPPRLNPPPSPFSDSSSTTSHHLQLQQRKVISDLPDTTPMVHRSTTYLSSAGPPLPLLPAFKRSRSLTTGASSSTQEQTRPEHRTMPPLPSILKSSSTFGLLSPHHTRSNSFSSRATTTPQLNLRRRMGHGVCTLPPIPSVSCDLPLLTTANSAESLTDSESSQQSSLETVELPTPTIPPTLIAATRSLDDDYDNHEVDDDVDVAAVIPNNTRLLRRCVSENNRAGIKFDPHVWVRVFLRPQDERDSTWYTPQDMDRFKKEAMQRILQYHRAELQLARNQQQAKSHRTGINTRTTTSTRATQVGIVQPKMLFSHRALSSCDDGPVEELKQQQAAAASSLSSLLHQTAEEEMATVLIVDPVEICQKLLSSAMQLLLPKANIQTVSNASEAKALCQSRSFDVILVEERLSPSTATSNSIIASFCSKRTSFSWLCGGGAVNKNSHSDPFIITSGSQLLQELSSNNKHNPSLLPSNNTNEESLYIGLTSSAPQQQYEQEFQTLLENGADVVWTKPPPFMTEELRNELLLKLLHKRGKHDLIQRLFQ